MVPISGLCHARVIVFLGVDYSAHGLGEFTVGDNVTVGDLAQLGVYSALEISGRLEIQGEVEGSALLLEVLIELPHRFL